MLRREYDEPVLIIRLYRVVSNTYLGKNNLRFSWINLNFTAEVMDMHFEAF